MKQTIFFFLLLCGALAMAQTPPRAIDPARSKMTVHAYKAGLFSFAGHDHTIAAPIASGEVREGGTASVSLTVNAREMKVLDPGLEAEKRAQVQRDMHAKVLKSEEYPVIEFRSQKVERRGPDVWRVTGQLTLHGKTQMVVVDVNRRGESFIGGARVRQSDFGITPISVAGGTIKVKDEVKIDFEINLK